MSYAILLAHIMAEDWTLSRGRLSNVAFQRYDSLATMDLSHKPQVLYRASLERIASAGRAFDENDHALAMYLSGLAVECILQSIALQHGAIPDARHDLILWLTRCPASLQDAIKGETRAEWNRVLALWDNGIRYLSTADLSGYIRGRGSVTGFSGGRSSVVRKTAMSLLDSARAVHNRGVVQWVSSTKR